jgi:hypothetical protein
MSTPEGNVKAEIKAFLNSLGAECWYFMPMMMGYGRKGIPDIIGCYHGYFFALEVKAPGKLHDATPWQQAECTKIAMAKGAVLIVDSVEAVRDMFRMVHRNAVQR